MFIHYRHSNAFAGPGRPDSSSSSIGHCEIFCVFTCENVDAIQRHAGIRGVTEDKRREKERAFATRAATRPYKGRREASRRTSRDFVPPPRSPAPPFSPSSATPRGHRHARGLGNDALPFASLESEPHLHWQQVAALNGRHPPPPPT